MVRDHIPESVAWWKFLRFSESCNADHSVGVCGIAVGGISGVCSGAGTAGDRPLSNVKRELLYHNFFCR